MTIHSMADQFGSNIGQIYLFLPMEKKLWDAVMETYSHLGKSAQICDIWTKIREFKQGYQAVTKYYSTL